MFMPDNDGLPSVDSSVKPMFFQQTQASINTYLINGLLDLEKEIAFCGDRVLDQLVVKRTGDGWLGMVGRPTHKHRAMQSPDRLRVPPVDVSAFTASLMSSRRSCPR